jgi:hypothetical protein
MMVKSLITPAELWFQENGSFLVSDKTAIFDTIGIDNTSSTLGVLDISADSTLIFSFSAGNAIDDESVIQYLRTDTGWKCTVNDASIATTSCPANL